MNDTLNIVAIIPVRLDSRRLNAKALRLVAGRRLVDYVIERARSITGITQVVVATTTRSLESPLIAHLEAHGVSIYRGEIEDVAGRLLHCAQEFGATHFVRINGDCVFADPSLIGQGIVHCTDSSVDFVTNLIDRTFPYGISVEIIKTDTFARLHRELGSSDEREHVTQHFYAHLDRFKVVAIRSPLPELRAARLVVDTPDDLARFSELVNVLGNKATTARFDTVASLYMNLERNLL